MYLLIYDLHSFFSDTTFTFPAKDGEAFDGAKYYEVKVKVKYDIDTKIDGCYKKINFHNTNKFTTTAHKYPIYKQTGGHFYLKIDVNEQFAPWLFTDQEGIFGYR